MCIHMKEKICADCRSEEERELKVLSQIVENYISDSKLREIVMNGLTEVWKGFRILSASESGRYHHYGLINHTLRVLWFCDQLYKEERGVRGIEAEVRDQLMAAAFIHDVGKLWDYKLHVRNSRDFAEHIGLPVFSQTAIRNHMHYWSQHRQNLTSLEEEIYCRILAYADYLASVNAIEIVGFKTFEERLAESGV